MTTEVSTEYIIEVKDLVVKYGDRVVLDGLNFRIRRGEVFVILGGSGCGKSTLLRTLVGLQRPSAGQILFRGADIAQMNDDELVEVRKRMGMCFQGSALFNSMTVADNVALPLREHTRLEESTIEIMTKIKLELVGLGGCGHLLPSELSGGMRKRAGLARAMAMDPEIIFYDEPSAGLDPIVAAGLDNLIRKLQSTFNLTSVVVTHEMASVEVIADTLCLLKGGRIIAMGTLDEVRANDHPFVRQFFERQPDDDVQENPDYIRSLTQA
ncbi:MAG TPA: ABC transporter ATP-binding protein [Candidatus Hydrogenedentes bacterium]|nr:ABC transporter ATP-binding protein [Candidatus Hydrogenedentota bacterium]HOL77118.1 ABC transporter ATP-binding protein [Candidatus Hydrogenedentota bacterium]HPO86963.1 ABC transporter ATP-binding protein [Candidatus Hydrogenedentota bacterium]